MTKIIDNNTEVRTILHTLRELGFNEKETKVYLALTKLGEARASEVAKKCGLARTTVISILERLVSESLVSEHSYKGISTYWIESPELLRGIYENKARLAGGLADIFKDLYRSEAHFPVSQTFDTKDSIKKFTEKLISGLPKDSTIYTIDSPNMGNYQKILSDEYYTVLLLAKKKKNIRTKTLIPAGTAKVIDPNKLLVQNIEIRELPAEIEFTASIWFVGQEVVFFSGRPPFVVSLRHEAIVKSLKSIFDYYWDK